MLGPLVRIKTRIIDVRHARMRIRDSAQKRIVVGAGGFCAPGWVRTEMEFLNLLAPRDWDRLADPESLDAILAEHVWEHLDADEARVAARICHKYLRPGGYLRVAVPDGLHPDPGYIELVRVGGTGAGADDHKQLYRYDSFAAVFESAGFEVRHCEHFDESGRFDFRAWDPRDGMIWRSLRFDERNRDGNPHYTSIVLDAVKPAAGIPRGPVDP
jgi:predicted SAM-dependent methyltransferase